MINFTVINYNNEAYCFHPHFLPVVWQTSSKCCPSQVTDTVTTDGQEASWVSWLGSLVGLK